MGWLWEHTLGYLSHPEWFWWEATVPLLGAPLAYLVLGLGMMATDHPTPWNWSRFAWKEAIDPFGWLYGSLIIAIQAARRPTTTSILGFFCWLAVIACG